MVALDVLVLVLARTEQLLPTLRVRTRDDLLSVLCRQERESVLCVFAIAIRLNASQAFLSWHSERAFFATVVAPLGADGDGFGGGGHWFLPSLDRLPIGNIRN